MFLIPIYKNLRFIKTHCVLYNKGLSCRHSVKSYYQVNSVKKEMQSSVKRTQPAQHRASPTKSMQISSPKQGTIYLPSFNGISSSSKFQHTDANIRSTESASISLSQSMQNLNEINMDNDGIQYVFDFTNSEIDNDDVFDIFEELTKDLHFQMIEREENHATAIKQVKHGSLLSKSGLTQMFLGCFPFLQGSGSTIAGRSVTSKAPTAIKIVVSKVTHDQKTRRIARIKGLSGLVKEIRVFIEQFKQKMINYLPEQSQQYSNYFFYDTDKETQHQNKRSVEHSDPYHLQISTFYVIQKILSNEVYQIGQITHRLILDYRDTFKNIEESVQLIPQPINNATKIVNEIFYWFNTNNQQSQQNMGRSTLRRSETEKEGQNIKKIPLHQSMTPFIRISIQKYVFKKLSHPIVDIYQLKNAQNELSFKNKRQRIFEKYSIRQILQQISLNQKFWGVKKQQCSQLDLIHNRKYTRNLLQMCPKCCAQLQKIKLTSNPRQKIKHMQLAYTSLKTFYYDFSKQKFELSSMEDIIPVLILVVLLLDIENLRQELDLMGNFIQCDPYEMESQKRLFINLSESYNYILRDWKV